MTVRQVFYQLVSQGVIGKTEQEYKGTVCRLLTEMRRARELPFHWLADNTRWQRKPRTHSCLEHAVEETARLYRRALWDDQPAYVEIWLEKDALAGVIDRVTGKHDVPLMVTRGYPSLTYVYSAAEYYESCEKPVFLYYLGDHDPSGVDIPRRVEKDLRDFAPSADITFERVAVNEDQIARYDLPTRPTKGTDSRAKNFTGESVEVDAIPPKTLREIVERCIERHIDADQLRITKAIEQEERTLAARFVPLARSWEANRQWAAQYAGEDSVDDDNGGDDG